jgi:hypothetical protein
MVSMPAPGWLLHATRADGVVRLVNHGSDRDRVQDPAGPPDPHYLRLAYTSHTGPDIGEEAIDGQLAVVSPRGVPSRRRHIQPLTVDDGFAASAYADGPVHVVTASVIDGAAEIRIHQVTAPAGHRVREGGHALAGQHPPATRSGDTWALARRPDGLTSVVRALHGYTGAGVGSAHGVNAFGPHSATPYLVCDHHPGGTAVYVSLVLLTAAEPEPPAPRVRVNGDEVTLTPPGGEPITVRLGGVPERVTHVLAGEPPERTGS